MLGWHGRNYSEWVLSYDNSGRDFLTATRRKYKCHIKLTYNSLKFISNRGRKEGRTMMMIRLGHDHRIENWNQDWSVGISIKNHFPETFLSNICHSVDSYNSNAFIFNVLSIFSVLKCCIWRCIIFGTDLILDFNMKYIHIKNSLSSSLPWNVIFILAFNINYCIPGSSTPFQELDGCAFWK